MNKVTWEANGRTYCAVKFEEEASIDHIEGMIREANESLIKEGFNIIKLIASPSTICVLKVRGGIKHEYYDGTNALILQTDRRLDNTFYLLYEEINIDLIEANEFHGLDTLP